MIKAVVFDMDDTLVQTKKVRYAAQKHMAKHFYDLVLSDEDIDQHWGKPFPQMMEAIYGPRAPLTEIMETYYSVTNLYPIGAYIGAAEAVTALSRRLPIGLLTAANQRLMEEAMSSARISPSLFSYIQTSDDTEYHKPDPLVFAPVVEHYRKWEIVPGEILYVGDAVSDYLAARGAGLDFVGIAGHTTDRETFERAGAVTIEDFNTLINLI